MSLEIKIKILYLWSDIEQTAAYKGIKVFYTNRN